MLAQFLMLSLLVSSTVNEQSEQLKRLIELHSKAREAIRTLHCTMDVKASEPSSPFNLTGIFWKNGNDYRLATNQLPSSKFAVRK